MNVLYHQDSEGLVRWEDMTFLNTLKSFASPDKVVVVKHSVFWSMPLPVHKKVILYLPMKVAMETRQPPLVFWKMMEGVCLKFPSYVDV